MIEVTYAERVELNFRQRWASYLTLVVLAFGLVAGYLVRNNIINAVAPFEVPEFGISALYPARWLRQQNRTGVIFSAQDPTSIPFKTLLEISLIPAGKDTRPEDIIYELNINRAAKRSTYRPLEIISRTLPNGTQGTQMTYSYSSIETVRQTRRYG